MKRGRAWLFFTRNSCLTLEASKKNSLYTKPWGGGDGGGVNRMLPFYF